MNRPKETVLTPNQIRFFVFLDEEKGNSMLDMLNVYDKKRMKAIRSDFIAFTKKKVNKNEEKNKE